jgi:hypothetical protein
MSKVIKGVVKWVADEKKYDNYGVRLVDRCEWFNSPNRAKGILEPGYEVKLTVEENERGGFNVTKKPVLVKKGKPPAKGGGKYGRGGGGYKKDPETEKRITMQHSQDVGVAVATLLLANGAVKLPGEKSVDNRKTVIVDLIDEQTAKAFNAAYNRDDVLGKAEETEEDLGESEEEESEEETEEAEESEESIEDEVPWDDD